ncbi:5-(carboxyamino)imidazole ribonucleotide synthase [Acidihalobacter ferrooxydans]|uniref:N5-carboxyaminoimidazole ribonucleotide synthase n=1 Tax=Acidihalobacter ferrooxydans TaxID=1765967 RepID=A0A1P8UKE3_9GAMM|nr:5-(carboxyamino)imidazole ribonucleotide synthase [Acidihalobacter ferrooxydans]APZ44264.1 5-(carboxyamino)imidazole ribonucleotide synthase [Acidihalobacter ferrooxydans]
MILPGATLGMLGGGQLGRLFTLAAHDLGYRVVVLDPDPDSPAGRVADEHLHAAYDDPWALDRMVQGCAAITTEFENIPAETLERLGASVPVFPSAAAVRTAQNRIREKTFLRASGFPTAPFAVIRDTQDLAGAMAEVGVPAILKRAEFGYDGKGQARIATAGDLQAAFARMGEVACVLERRVDLALEVSVVLARGIAGQACCYPVAENEHRNGILDVSIVPARIDPDLAVTARDMALGVAAALEYQGVMAVEFFVTHDDELLINEIAPRPHNSGHYTVDACASSQFEQQLRALCGLPLGDTRLLSPVAMVNLLGDLWAKREPRWSSVFAAPGARLHLYGKREARVGRKMGHYCVLGENVDSALALAREIYRAL